MGVTSTMKPSPDNIFFYLHAKKQFHTNSPRLKCSTTTSKKPFKLQHRTQRYLATRWVTFSFMRCSKLVSLLQGTSSELSLGCVLFLSLSEWKWDLRFQSCPWDIPIFSISFTLGLGIACSSSHWRSINSSLATWFAPFLWVRTKRAVLSSPKQRKVDRFLLLLCWTLALIRTKNERWVRRRGKAGAER